MSNFAPNSHHLRQVLLHYFISKKTAAESHRILMSLWWTFALSETTYRDWFWRFKSGDFDLSKKRPWKTTEQILSCRIASIAGRRLNSNSKTIGKSIGTWPGNYFQTLTCHWKDPERRTMGAVRIKRKRHWKAKTTCKILFDRFKIESFSHRIVTGYEKWIYFDNPKRKKSWADPGQPWTSQPVRNIHGKKDLLCIWWDHEGAV